MTSYIGLNYSEPARYLQHISPKAKEYSSYLVVDGNVSKIDYMLAHKANLEMEKLTLKLK